MARSKKQLQSFVASANQSETDSTGLVESSQSEKTGSSDTLYSPVVELSDEVQLETPGSNLRAVEVQFQGPTKVFNLSDGLLKVSDRQVGIVVSEAGIMLTSEAVVGIEFIPWSNVRKVGYRP